MKKGPSMYQNNATFIHEAVGCLGSSLQLEAEARTGVALHAWHAQTDPLLTSPYGPRATHLSWL
jgi:hypothetical protein